MTTTEWRYQARLVRVVDGDTLDFRVVRDIDFGFRMLQKMSAVMRFRIVGIDTPEKVGATRALGLAASSYVEHLLAGNADPEVLSLGEPDKYGGRWDARVEFSFGPAQQRVDLAEHLVLSGYAMPYTGQGPRPAWDPARTFPLEPALRWRLRGGTWLPPERQ